MPVRLTSLRRQRWLASLLVVAFALRTLIPVGFMPVLDADGHLMLGLCPAVAAPAEQGTAAAAHSHHHHHLDDSGAPGQSGDQGHHRGAGQDHALCLFAATTGGAPLSITLDTLVVPQDASLAPDSERSTLFVPTIVRAQSSRGPPVSASI